MVPNWLATNEIPKSTNTYSNPNKLIWLATQSGLEGFQSRHHYHLQYLHPK